ncbi:hypothetical protein GCM10010371_57400 [Streptomyces subrutilus]|uniref:Uncharacterized protein n=1 Tax=Streptomyces subrutilus TaxID=36818 RepID=A0A918VDQ3_9ACTN|nr:hypothetical protein GCM10010371_57400 [Streptomyces subrutilus]
MPHVKRLLPQYRTRRLQSLLHLCIVTKRQRQLGGLVERGLKKLADVKMRRYAFTGEIRTSQIQPLDLGTGERRS